MKAQNGGQNFSTNLSQSATYQALAPSCLSFAKLKHVELGSERSSNQIWPYPQSCLLEMQSLPLGIGTWFSRHPTPCRGARPGEEAPAWCSAQQGSGSFGFPWPPLPVIKLVFTWLQPVTLVFAIFTCLPHGGFHTPRRLPTPTPPPSTPTLHPHPPPPLPWPRPLRFPVVAPPSRRPE